MYEKVVLVTRATRLEGLVERFNSRGQAQFYLEHAGEDFSEYQREHDAYQRSLETLRRSLDTGLKLQALDRRFVPTYLFTEEDVVVALGQDGLVANTAKYAGSQPIVGVNPDPERIDGILLPFTPVQAGAALEGVLEGKARLRAVTLCEASLNDGQKLLAFNDLFIGARSHVSARYRIAFNGSSETQLSSGLIVSTGAGSTGWLSSLFNMAAGVAAFRGGGGFEPLRLDWEDPRLVFVVREPFRSRASSAGIAAGILEPDGTLELSSLMPSGGVIFSDGVEQDALAFDSGARARVRAAAQKARLVI
ncbi:MAG TPA: NAD+ kinase [Elusimicrobia bacterium]|nr:NAD+ kinase [Elusimicrobiota bacterium]